MGTITKGDIGEQDISRWDGTSTKTFTRATSTGGTLTLMKVGHEVDALVSYGGCVNYTDATITAALAGIGTTNKAALALRPGTWTIDENVDWSAYTNVTLKLAPGAYISHGAFTISLPGGFDFPDAQVFIGAGAITFPTKISSPLKSVWWGDTGDGATDDYAAIQAALTALSGTSGGKLIINDGSHLLSEGVTWTGSYTEVDCRGWLLHNTINAEVAVTIGDVAAATVGLRGNIKVMDNKGSVWTTAKTGIKTINLYDSELHFDIGGSGIAGNGGFAIGHHVYAINSGHYFNKFFYGRMTENKIGLTSSEGAGGYTNKNDFYGGRFTAFLAHAGEWANSYHVKWDTGNGCTFYSPDFEQGNYYCYFYNNDAYNTLAHPRIEGSPTYKIFNDTGGGYFTYIAGYLSVNFMPSGGCVDLATNPMRVIGDLSSVRTSRGNKIYSTSSLPTTGTFKQGDILNQYDVTYGEWLLKACVTAGTYSAATDHTGDTDGSTAVITGMTDTSDFYVGEYVTVSAGFPSATVPYKILALTATTMTLNTDSDSAQNNVTVATPAPVWYEAAVALTRDTVQNITYAAAIDIDLSLGDVALVATLSGDIKLNNPTNARTGQRFFVAITCDGSGRNITYGTKYQASTATITASKKVVLEFVVLQTATIRQVGTPVEIT